MQGFQPRKQQPMQDAPQPGLGFKPGMRIQPAAAPEPRLGFRPRADDAGAALAQAQNQQPDSIPAMTKPGEFVLPPDTVHAMGGKDALNQVVDATHTPAPEVAYVPRGFKPRAYFAQGGASEDELNAQSRVASPNNTFPGNRTQGTSGYSGAPATANPAAPTPSATPTATGGGAAGGFMPSARSVFNESGKEISDLAKQGRYGAAAGETARAAAAYVPAVLDDVVGGAVRAVGPSVMDAGRQLFGLNGAQAATPAATTAPATQPAPTPAPNPTDQRLAAGTQASPGASAAATSSASLSPAPGPATSGMVTRDGNSYSGTNVAGDISINGKAPSGSVASLPAGATPIAAGFNPGMRANAAPAQQLVGGWPPRPLISDQNMTAANNLADRSQLESMGRLMASGQIAAPAAGPSMSLSGDTFGFRRARPIVAAELGAQRQFQYGQGNDPASRARNAQIQQTAMRESGDSQRAAMRESGENYRAGFRGRADAERNQIERDRLGLEQTAAGFKTRAAKQLEDIQRVYLDPNSTPEQRAQAQASMFALQGKSPEGRWKGIALQGGTDPQGNKTDSVLAAVNEQTGEMRKYGAQGAGGPPDAAIAALKADPKRAAEFNTKYGAQFGANIAERLLGA